MSILPTVIIKYLYRWVWKYVSKINMFKL